MFEKITLRVFLVCLVSCASLVLFLIWTGGPNQPDSPVFFKTTATFFIIGLASFLLWFVKMLYSLRRALGEPRFSA